MPAKPAAQAPLLAYSSDAVYLYSTRDDPEPTCMGSRESSLIPPNKKRQKLSEDVDGSDTAETDTEMTQERADRDARMEEDIERMLAEDSPSPRARRELRPLLSDDMDEDDPDVREPDEDDEDDEDEDSSHGDERYAKVPTIMPRSRFEGICNVETVKDGMCYALDPSYESDILP